MRISVGIATWNRAQLLKGTLHRLFQAEAPDGVEVEVVVVDNGSTDDTPRVLAAFSDTHGVRSFTEAQPGKSHALNKAMTKASGEIIIWIDDDIRVDADWLIRYVDAFRTYPAVAVFGGSITPRFLSTPPTWITEGMSEVGGVYGLCDPPDGPIMRDGPFLPFGGNMAIRRDIQLRYLYDPQLGRRHGQLLAGEESAVVHRILGDGGEGRWVPAAHVWHLIPEKMQSLEHVRRYFHDLGASLTFRTEPGRAGLPPAWAFRDAVEQEIRYRLGRPLGTPPRSWLRNLRLASFAQGTLRGKPMRPSR
jgi:glucosyl-dolichyl phosphate glucuronosyltransferase